MCDQMTYLVVTKRKYYMIKFKVKRHRLSEMTGSSSPFPYFFVTHHFIPNLPQVRGALQEPHKKDVKKARTDYTKINYKNCYGRV